MDALSNDPLPSAPSSSRALIVALAVAAVGAGAIGLFAVVHALQGPSREHAAPAATVTAEATPTVTPQPPVAAPPAVTASEVLAPPAAPLAPPAVSVASSASPAPTRPAAVARVRTPDATKPTSPAPARNCDPPFESTPQVVTT